MTGARSRNKGDNAERAVAGYMRDNGFPDARRYLAGDGRQPGDIDAIAGVALEVKDQAKYCLAEWVAQAIAEANGRIPAVVMHPKGVADVGKWWVVMEFDAFLSLVAEEE